MNRGTQLVRIQSFQLGIQGLGPLDPGIQKCGDNIFELNLLPVFLDGTQTFQEFRQTVKGHYFQSHRHQDFGGIEQYIDDQLIPPR